MSTATYEALSTEEAAPVHKKEAKSPFRKYLVAFALIAGLAAAYYTGRVHQEYLDRHPSSSSPTNQTTAHDTNSNSNSNSNSTSNTSMSPNGKVQVGYFTNWGIYGRKYPPSQIPAQKLTHILYAFANVRPESGEVYLSDLWADEQIHYAGDSWDEVPGQRELYGNLKQIGLVMKREHRHLKLLLSIGGWTYSSNFHPVVVNPALRQGFVQSAVKLVADYALDGLDIDYEYPQNEEQARGYVDLLRELRYGLDNLAHQLGGEGRFTLTIAAPCGESNYGKLYVNEMDRYLDFWNLMAYDYAGSWDSVAGHQANVFGPQERPSTAAAVHYYHAVGGVPKHKLVIGIPVYGRSFMKTRGPGQPYDGLGQGSHEAGTWDYRDLPRPGAEVYRDMNLLASWTHDSNTGEMVTFDDDVIAHAKARWIVHEGLGGAMYWELSGDKGARPEVGEVPGPSLVTVVADVFAQVGLDTSANRVWYPSSVFSNVRG